MNTFTQPTDRASAIAFLAELQAKGLSYHPDDCARECLAGHGLTAGALDEISANMAATFAFVDPYIVGMGLSHGFTPADEDQIAECADLYEGEDIAFFWQWNGVVFAQFRDGDADYLVILLSDEHRLQWFHEVKDVIRRFCEEEGVEIVEDEQGSN
jgi:hypothetical protein